MPACRISARASQPISLPPWAVARNVGWPEQARLAARVGYKCIDWAFGPAKTAGVEATRALLAELAIVPTIVNLPMQGTLGPDDAAFEFGWYSKARSTPKTESPEVIPRGIRRPTE